MPDDTILCWKTSLNTATGHVTVADYNAWKADGERSKDKIAAFFRERLRERYIEPIAALPAANKNGFSVMATSCLLIETYEAFRQGWASTQKKGRSPLSFSQFFDREKLFLDFKGHAQEFYKNIRCGILHQGETTHGWQITRKSAAPLFSPSTHTVNATKFHTSLAKVIDNYRDALKSNALTTDIWKNFTAKMAATIKNCEI